MNKRNKTPDILRPPFAVVQLKLCVACYTNCGLAPSVGAALYVTACGREKVIFAYKCGPSGYQLLMRGERGQIFMRQKMRHTLRSAKESVAQDGTDSSPVRCLGANTRCGESRVSAMLKRMLLSFQFTLRG